MQNFDKLINFIMLYILTTIRKLKNEKIDTLYGTEKAYLHISFRNHCVGFFNADEYCRCGATHKAL